MGVFWLLGGEGDGDLDDRDKGKAQGARSHSLLGLLPRVSASGRTPLRLRSAFRARPVGAGVCHSQGVLSNVSVVTVMF